MVTVEACSHSVTSVVMDAERMIMRRMMMMMMMDTSVHTAAGYRLT